VLCVPGPRLGRAEPRARVRDLAEPDAARHRVRVVRKPARARVRADAAGGVPDAGAADGGPAHAPRARRGLVRAPRGPEAVRARAGEERDVGECRGGDGVMGVWGCRERGIGLDIRNSKWGS
jgi:hypothetical protein